MTDFNLSDKINKAIGMPTFLYEEDVKEFIRLLKEAFVVEWTKDIFNVDKFEKKIDELAGEKLL
jgi:hypothetical protein